jgi:hypothetical protein
MMELRVTGTQLKFSQSGGLHAPPSGAAPVNVKRSTLLTGVIVCMVLNSMLILAMLAPAMVHWSF